MDKYNLFDLIRDLPFDPPEKTQKVKDAIENKKKNLREDPDYSKQEERIKIDEKVQHLNSCYKDGVFTHRYEEQAREKVELEIGKLKKIVSELNYREFTTGTILSHSKRTNLSTNNVKNVFKDAGFMEISKDELVKLHYPQFPKNMDETYKTLEALRNSKEKDTRQGREKVTDLYAFAAFWMGEIDNAQEYQKKLTSEIAGLFNTFNDEIQRLSGDLGNLFKKLSASGKSNVFDSETHRQEYDTYLKYKSPSLMEVFSSLKSYSPNNKQELLDPELAEIFIKKISTEFGCDYKTAVCIYNSEGGLQGNPYIPAKIRFQIPCPNPACRFLITTFKDEAEAQEKNECPNCKHALYKQCRECRRKIPISLDKCPDCGYVFPNAALFAKYFAAAEQAFRKSDFESARSLLFQAQSADPGEKARIDEFAARIGAEEKKYEKPINDLRKLIADKMFQKASNALADIIGKFPSLNVSTYETQINTALSQARTAFANAKKLSPSRQADECLSILRDCVDFEPAISYLQSTPPEACKSLSAGIDSSAGCANISWPRSSEQGISYRLVRKQSKETPVNEKDGEVLVDDTRETSYRDKAILPGQTYSYAVFTIRYGVFSAATGKTTVLLADVSDVHAEQINTTIRLTWNAPKNSTGLTIYRTHNGTETVLTNHAYGSFEDKNVQYGTAYHYKLCANYANLPASQGVALVITPLLKIDSFKIDAAQVKENTYKISWTINRAGIDLRVLVDEKLARELKSDAGSCDVELPADGFRTITVLAYSGGNWLRSDNSPQVNTFSPCSIDKAASRFHEEPITGLQESAYSIELHLKIGGLIPSSVAGFYYTVRTGASQNRWPAVAEIGSAADIHRISLAAYQKNGEILYTETAHEEGSYYVSLFTIYNMGGKEIISNQKPCRFDRPLTANLFWKVSRNILGGLKLSIEVSCNRPMARIPELVLCTCADNQHLLSCDDPKGTRLLLLPAADLGSPQKVYRNSYDVKMDLSARQLKSTKFFFFEVAPITGENFTLRRIEGFTGKI